MAARSLGVLSLDLVLRLGGFTEGMDRAARETARGAKKIEQSLHGIHGVFEKLETGLGLIGLGFGLHEIIEATAEAQKTFALLQNAVENNGGAAGKTAEELEAVSLQLQHVSTYSDDAIQNMQTLLLSFRSIKGDNFDRATQSVLDLATRLGKDLPTAALLVGKALEDPLKGMRQLARAGVVLSPIQQHLIKDLVDTGKAAQAQGIILDALESSYHGAAAAARDNFGGAIEGLKNDFHNLLEARGGLPAATDAINDLSKALQDPATKQAADILIEKLLQIGAAALKGSAGAIEGLGLIGDVIRNLATVATSGVELNVHLSQEDIAGQIKDIEARLKVLRETNTVLIPTKLEALETKELERRLAFFKSQQIVIPVAFETKKLSAGLDLSQEQLEQIDKLVESSEDAKEKIDKQLDLVWKGFLRNTITAKEYAAVVKHLNEQLAKPVKKAGLTDAQQAQKGINDLIVSLRQQGAVLGETQEATIKYRIAFGDLVDDFKKAGPAFEKRKQDLIDAAHAADQFKANDELDKANAQIEQQIVDLEAARIAMEQGAAAAFIYQSQHGELAKTLDLATDSQQALNAAVQRGAEEAAKLEHAQAVAAAEALIRSTEDATSAIIANSIAENEGAVAAIRYRIAHGDLKKMFEELGPAAAESQAALEKAAAAQEVLTQKQKEDAASESIIPSRTKAVEEYNDAIAGLERRLASGDITQREFNAGIKIAEKNFKEATRAIDDMSVFAEQAAKNMQDAFADFLFDPFEKGLGGMLEDFSKTLRQMAAQIVAAKIAEKFHFEDIFKGGGIFGGGSGATPPFFPEGIKLPGGATTTLPTGAGGTLDPGLGASVPPLIGAATTAAATASTAAATTMATAITTAGATAGTVIGTAITTAGATAATVIGTAITTAGAAAAASIAAASAAGGAASGLEEIAVHALRLEKGGYLPPGELGVVGDSASGAANPEVLIGGRAESRDRFGIVALAPPSGLTRPPSIGQPIVVGRSPDGRERPQFVFGGSRGITVIPLKDTRTEKLIGPVLPRVNVNVGTRPDWRFEREDFAGYFAAGGFIPAGKVGVVGDSMSGAAARELLLPGQLASGTNSKPPMVVQQSITVNSPNGQVSQATKLQITAAAARGARVADQRNN